MSTYPPPACRRCGYPCDVQGNILTPDRVYGVCRQCRAGGRSRDWRHELVWVIRQQPARTPIKRDPDLWEAFAPDREHTTVKALPTIRPCIGCGRPTRPSHSRRADYPGTVLRHGRELCITCRKKTERPSNG